MIISGWSDWAEVPGGLMEQVAHWIGRAKDCNNWVLPSLHCILLEDQLDGGSPPTCNISLFAIRAQIVSLDCAFPTSGFSIASSPLGTMGLESWRLSINWFIGGLNLLLNKCMHLISYLPFPNVRNSSGPIAASWRQRVLMVEKFILIYDYRAYYCV